MPYNEADTRAKLIDPTIHKQGWTEDLIRREETAGAVEIINGKPRRRSEGKIDYVLRVKIDIDIQPVALALIEAKRENLHAGHGLDQAKWYAECSRLNVRFVFSTNGHQFVEFDCFTGLTAAQKPLTEFPPPSELRARYEKGMGFPLESPAARPLLQQYHGGEGGRRHYQDTAIRAVMEKIARCEVARQPKRSLLSLATGTGKTFIAVNLLKRISDAGQLTRALFVCDRDKLITTLVKSGYSPTVVRLVEDRQDYDLYAVLAELDWVMNPRTRHDRTLAFTYKHEDLLSKLPGQASSAIRAIAGQFDRGGTDGLENPQIFQTPEVKMAGGMAALQMAGNSRDLLVKQRSECLRLKFSGGNQQWTKTLSLNARKY